MHEDVADVNPKPHGRPIVPIRPNRWHLRKRQTRFSAPLQVPLQSVGTAGYCTSSGSVPVTRPSASVVIFSTRASACRSNSSHRRFSASPRS